MIKTKANIKTLKNVSINFNLSSDYGIEQDEVFHNRFLNAQALKEVNPIFDAESVLFMPLGFDNIKINVKSATDTLSYEDFGFDDEDVLLRTNRFVNSFLRINYYTSFDPANQQLIYQTNLRPQLNSNFDLLAFEQKISFNIYNPKKMINNSLNSLGYGIRFFKTPNNFSFPFNLYAEYQFLNAINGEIISLISSNDTITYENLYSKLYIKHTLNKINNNYIYSVDQNDRNISISGGNKIVDLKILQLT